MSPRIPKCPNGHIPEYWYLSVDSYPPDPPIEEFILMDSNGDITNRWADGTAGIPQWVRELAEYSESVFCPECLTGCNWIDNPSPAEA